MKVKDLLTDKSKWLKKRTKEFANPRTMYRYGVAPIPCKWCLAAAIDECYKNKAFYDIVEKVAAHINYQSFILREYHPLDSIIKWNDQPERTFEEVRGVIETLDI